MSVFDYGVDNLSNEVDCDSGSSLLSETMAFCFQNK